jgi:insulysin
MKDVDKENDNKEETENKNLLPASQKNLEEDIIICPKSFSKPSTEEDLDKINSKLTLYIYGMMMFAIFILFIFLFFYIHYGSYRIEMLVSEKEIIKPLVDDRKYRVVKLTNNLEVLLISDLSSSRCSASMSVGVGSFQDDEDILGLAHFTEHMIFLGSKSYPRPGEFEDLLSNYFGITNAFTQDERTTFYFEVGSRGFQKALIMFSRMFAEPLFDIQFMSKEIEAVNSENEKNLNQDPWKQHQLLRNLSNKNHPYSKFHTGNNNTLGIDPVILNKRLNAFFDKYYIPGNMKLVVLSNQPLDHMQANIAQFFSDIRLDSLSKDQGKKYGEIRTVQKAFTGEELGKIVHYQKTGAIPNLDFIFSIDQVISNYQTKPIDYLTYLMKYSGEGSLSKFLKDKKWINKLDVGVIASYKNFSEWALSYQLTDSGLENVIPIMDATFNYINIIKKSPLNYSIYEEIHNITKIEFKFQEKNEKYGDYLASLANVMFDYNYREVLYGDYLHSFYNESMIKNYMEQIKPESAIIMLGSNKSPDQTLMNTFFKNSTNQTEKWYGTRFMQHKFDDKILQILNNENIAGNNTNMFKIRPKNEYITTENFVVSCLDDNVFYIYL